MAYTLDDLIAELDACRDESALSPQGKKALEVLKTLLEEGEDSGWIEDFDFDEFLAEMHKKSVRKNASDVA